MMRLLGDLSPEFEIVVIDSPNQISPIMENRIYSTDLFIVPFESTKAVRGTPTSTSCSSRSNRRMSIVFLHVLSNVTRQRGLRNRVIALMNADRIPLAATELPTAMCREAGSAHGRRSRREYLTE